MIEYIFSESTLHIHSRSCGIRTCEFMNMNGLTVRLKCMFEYQLLPERHKRYLHKKEQGISMNGEN